MMTQQAIELGRVLAGRYRIEAVLGRGAVGAVYRTLDLQTHSACAMKVLHASLGEDDDAHARFLNEGQVIAQLFHPHIVEMLEFGRDADGTPFLVMELLSGPTLLDVIRGGGRLPLSRVIDIARQIGSALHAAHSVGIVHRDIKPQNIVLHREKSAAGGKDVVKVVDFGLSRMLTARGQHTAPGIIVGTIEYMSPEATSGKREEIDARTDQWALAVVVYRLLSGRLPFQGSDAVRLLLQIRRDEPPSLASLVQGLPPFVSAAVERALRKNKHERFESVQDFVRALQGLPVRAVGGESSASSERASLGESREARPAIPQPVVPEPSTPYVEYCTATHSGRAVTAGNYAQVARGGAASALAPTAHSLLAGLSGSGPGRLPSQLWLGLVGLSLTALLLFALVLAQSRAFSPYSIGSRAGSRSLSADPGRYFRPLLGSR